MSMSRMLRAVAAASVLAASLFVLASCKVDKSALARQVNLRSPDLSTVPGGTYEAAYTIAPPAGSMAANKHVRVRVTVAGGKYEKIELLEPDGLRTSKMTLALIAKIQETQALSVDAVSGATITSVAILKAVQEAVTSAGK